MYPEITIKISVSPEGAMISREPTPTVVGVVPEPPSLAELEAMAGAEVGEAPEPPSLEELEAMAEGEVPEPPSPEELEAMAEGEVPEPPSP